MIPKTDFHCITTWVAHVFLVKFGISLLCGLVFTSQMVLLFNINILTEYILIGSPNCDFKFLAGKENSFNPQGLLNDINNQDT